jgi:hypothetical protein
MPARGSFDLEPTLISAVAVVAEGVGVVRAVGDDEELERLGGHRGRGRGRQVTVAEEGKRRSRAPVRCRRQTVSSPAASADWDPLGAAPNRCLAPSRVNADAEAHLLAAMSVLSVLPPHPS